MAIGFLHLLLVDQKNAYPAPGADEDPVSHCFQGIYIKVLEIQEGRVEGFQAGPEPTQPLEVGPEPKVAAVVGSHAQDPVARQTVQHRVACV